MGRMTTKSTANIARKPTLGSVAKAAGVSIPTVSQVMRGTGRISKQTREKVLEAAKRLHYVPDTRAASMRSGESREIGFVINRLTNPFNGEVIRGVVDLLEVEGYLVSVLDTRDDADRQGRQLEAFIRNRRAGLLWVPAQSTGQSTFDLLAAHQTPTVTFLRPLGEEFDHVGIRDAEAVSKAVHYLADLGHHNIAYLGGIDMSAVRAARVQGYTTAMQDRGLGPMVIWDSDDTKRAGMDAMFDLLARHPDTTAVVCNGDVVALGACLALIRAGMQPGQDVSVIGFDDIDDASVATPALTTMAVSPFNLGRKLARALLERIRDPEMPATRSEVSADLIVRETTGPAR